jgi:hypothetical protein
MANHAYIINCKVPIEREGVEALVDRFIDEILNRPSGPLFRLDKPVNASDTWLLRLDNDDDPIYDGVQFWIDDDEVDGPHIALSHGHGHDSWWYIDFALEHWLAYHLDGKIRDDASDVVSDPNLNDYIDINDYIQRRIDRGSEMMRKRAEREEREFDKIYNQHMNAITFSSFAGGEIACPELSKMVDRSRFPAYTDEAIADATAYMKALYTNRITST